MKELFAMISIEKENKKDIVKIYKTRDKKFGIEIERQKGDRLIIDKVENLTESNEKINKLLETIIESTQNFTLLESFAYDFADDMSLSCKA